MEFIGRAAPVATHTVDSGGRHVEIESPSALLLRDCFGGRALRVRRRGTNIAEHRADMPGLGTARHFSTFDTVLRLVSHRRDAEHDKRRRLTR
jgi:hypothetical protein